MIRIRVYLAVAALLLAAVTGLLGQARQTAAEADRGAPRQLVATLTLTDLALWSEARYTRHPAMADLFSPFQDHPGAFEHFPAGALLTPSGPRPKTTLQVRRRAGQVH